MDDTNRQAEATTGKVQVTCPYCFSVDNELYSLFGQQLLTMQYYCNTCHTPFEYVKDAIVYLSAKGHSDDDYHN